MNLFKEITEMFSRELELRGRAFVNYQALSGVEVKDMTIDGFPAKLFFNPARVRSVMADVSPEALQKRACFLCPDGLELNQLTTVWDSPTGQTYFIRVNPFPIFNHHFTISSAIHERQTFAPHMESMLHLAQAMPEMSIFYNGPMCGASAPDHMHFQAVPRHSMPIEDHFDTNYANAVLVQESDLQSHLAALKKVLSMASIPENASQTGSLTAGASRTEEWEPRWNIISWYEPESSASVVSDLQGKARSTGASDLQPTGRSYNTIVFFRKESRPQCFFAPENERILFSPGTVEMGGVGIVANRESFDRITPRVLRSMIQEVADKIV
ncbi:MAG: DUF4922 domain-containing protein [Paludibacteraceae bacterium]|nr:DUF4922 domain-containing protein [Paludibacteraceae bacterium]